MRVNVVLAPVEREDAAQSAEGEEVSLGRDTSCDFRLSDEMAGPRHAVIRGRDGIGRSIPPSFILEDLDWPSGTFLNGRPITRATLVEGDVIGIGAEQWSVISLDFPDLAPVASSVSPEARSSACIDTVEALEFAIERARAAVAKAMTAVEGAASSPSDAMDKVNTTFDRLQEQRDNV